MSTDHLFIINKNAIFECIYKNLTLKLSHYQCFYFIEKVNFADYTLVLFRSETFLDLCKWSILTLHVLSLGNASSKTGQCLMGVDKMTETPRRNRKKHSNMYQLCLVFSVPIPNIVIK